MASVGALLLLTCCSLCWRLSLADHLELDSALTTSSTSDEAQTFSAPGILTTTLEGNPFEIEHNHPIFDLKDEKWKRVVGEVADWVLHACVVVLAIFAIYYTLSCICVCCIGLDLLKEIWRVLGGWTAFSYFVRVEEAVVETDPPPLPFLRRVAEEP